MELTLKINKTLEQNAAVYFEKSKKMKKKLEGAKKALEFSKKKLFSEQQEVVKQEVKQIRPLKGEWYEKFKWFFTSDGFLVIGGKDATTNELIIKKHTEKNDLVFHTEMAGSPFAVIKAENQEVPELAKEETAAFVMVHSRAWKLGLAGARVFYVRPEQLSKSPKTGEFLAKGAFIISGKASYVQPSFDFAAGIYNSKVMGGPVSAIKKHCKEFVEITPGDEKTSDLAKIIKKRLGWQGSLDDIIKVLPSGGCAVKLK